MSTSASETKTEPSSRSRSLARIGPGSSGRLMTREEFDALRPEQFIGRNRYELINGVLIVSPRAGLGERNPNDELGYLIRLYRDTPPHGAIIDGTAPEQAVPATNSRIADRVVWTGLGRVPDETTDIPSIVVEFVSKRRRDALRDYETKRDEYLRAGVQQYWIIDRFRRVMIVYRLGIAGPTYDIVTENQTYQTDLLPGFVLPLAKLLAQADQVKQKKARPKNPPKPKPPAGGTDG